MEQNKNIQPSQALVLNTDATDSNRKPSELSHVVNAIVEGQDGGKYTLQTEEGNNYCFSFPEGYRVVGKKEMPQKDRVYFWLANPKTGDSNIGYAQNCTYHTLISDENQSKKIGLSVNHPIHKVVVKQTNCSTQFYWTDGNMPRYYIDEENLPWAETPNPDNAFKPIKLVGTLDTNKMLVQPLFEIPRIHPVVMETGGNLDMGVYQFMVQYSNFNGDAYTSMYGKTNPVGVFENKTGIEAQNSKTSKAITIQIDGIDTSGLYDYFNIVVVKTKDMVSTPYVIETLPITNSSHTYTYTGNSNNPIPISMSDVLEQHPYYDVAQEVWEVDNLIGWAKLTKAQAINFQKIWNNVDVQWETWKIPYNKFEGYFNGVNVANLRGYMRDEVIALEGGFIRKNGELLPSFHIPGRIAKASDLEIIPLSNKDAGAYGNNPCDDPEEKPRWQVYNTGSLIGFTDEYTEYINTHDPECFTIEKEVPGDIIKYTGSISYDSDCVTVTLDNPAPVGGLTVRVGYTVKTDLNYELFLGYDVVEEVDENLTPLFSNTMDITIPAGQTTGTYCGNVPGWVNLLDDSIVSEYGTVNPEIKKLYVKIDCGEFVLNAPLSNKGIKITFPDVKDAPFVGASYQLTSNYWGTLEVKVESVVPNNTTPVSYTVVVKVDKILRSLYSSSLDDCDAVTNIIPSHERDFGGGYSLKPIFSGTPLTLNLTGWPQANSISYSINCESGLEIISVSDTNCVKIVKEEICIPDRCYVGPYQYGEMGYWESSANYPKNPDIWGELEGKPIRHHKLPDSVITHIHDNNLTGEKSWEHSIFPIGFRIVAESLYEAVERSSLSTKEKEDIAGFYIARGNRANNKSIIAKGYFTNVGKYKEQDGGKERFYANYPYNCLNKDPFFSKKKLTEKTGYSEADALDGFGEHSKSRFTFYSPDTLFTQPELGDGFVKIETIEYGNSWGHFVKVRDNAEYKFLTRDTLKAAAGIATAAGMIIGAGTFGWPNFEVGRMLPAFKETMELFEKLAPHTNFGRAYHSHGIYSNFKPVSNDGFKIRGLEYSRYLTPGFQSVELGKTINHFQREGAVYLNTKETFKYPHEYDNIPLDDSRFLPTWDDLEKEVKRNIAGYYGSIKRNIPDLWGSIYSYETVDCGYFQPINLTDSTNRLNRFPTVFGGDTYINQMDLKVKLPFYRTNSVGQEDGSDVQYDEHGNLGFPMFWLSTKPSKFDINISGALANLDAQFNPKDLGTAIIDVIGNLLTAGGLGTGVAISFIAKLLKEVYEKIGVKNINLHKAYTKGIVDLGLHYLFAYGVPQFFCESQVNVDYRFAIDERAGNFYRNIGGDIPDDWFQEVNVSINNDNQYHYNKTYSLQNKLTSFSHLREDWDPNKTCLYEFPNRAIWSDASSMEETKNNWLFYKPLAYYDFPKNHGELITIDKLENKQLLVRFENKAQIYNALTTVETSRGLAYMGNNALFSASPPLDLADTDNGHSGSSHRLFIKTPYGPVYVDAVRGQVLLLNGRTPLPISEKGMSKWLQENLPFTKVIKQFPLLNTDNAAAGFGITGVYDPFHSRMLITKRYYEPLDPCIRYDPQVGFYYDCNPSSNSLCPPGYVFENNACVKKSYASPSEPTEFSVVPKQFSLYGKDGMNLYNQGFDIASNGTYVTSLSDYWKEKINNIAIWAADDVAAQNKWLGFEECIDVQESKTYYFGISADNYFRFKVNGVELINTFPKEIVWNAFNIYPVYLTKGLHKISLEGFDTGFIGMVAAEIYDNNPAQILNATDDSDLNILFTTKGKTKFKWFGYQCPEGYTLIAGDNPCDYPKCEKIETVPVNLDLVDINDTKYFANRSWTLSYSFDPNVQSWVSFHSYTPDFYLSFPDTFATGTNSEVWVHGKNFKLFNNFYGNNCPYILEYPLFFPKEQVLQSFEDITSSRQYEDWNIYFEPQHPIYFNKGIIYTGQSCSGLLHFIPKIDSNYFERYPKYFPAHKEVKVTKIDSGYRINSITDVVTDKSKAFFQRSTNFPMEDKTLVDSTLSYTHQFKETPLRGRMFKIRLILDNRNDTRLVSQFLLSESTNSIK